MCGCSVVDRVGEKCAQGVLVERFFQNGNPRSVFELFPRFSRTTRDDHERAVAGVELFLDAVVQLIAVHAAFPVDLEIRDDECDFLVRRGCPCRRRPLLAFCPRVPVVARMRVA